MWFVGAPVSFAADDGDIVPLDAGLVATRPGDRHITLVFLGRVPSETVERFWGSLPPLRLPERVRPLRWERFGRNAVALALADDELLAAAADECHNAAEGLVELRRPSELRLHVTLARVPRRSRPPSRQTLREWAVPSGPVEVGRLTLFRSRTGGTGDRYEVVEQQSTSEG